MNTILKWLATRRLNYIDGVAASVAGIGIHQEEYIKVVILCILLAILSVFLENRYGTNTTRTS